MPLRSADGSPNLLITGVTGFLGGALLAHVVERFPCGRVLVLVRGDSAALARERLRKSLAHYVDRAGLERALERVDILRGDLADAATLDDPRLDRVSHVAHLAAHTSFRSVRTARRTNIDGTMNLARRMRRVPRLERFLHVSTAYICGANPPAVVHEDDYPRPGVHHVAEYTCSKAECEALLETLALPLIMARPSVVVGHSRLGCLPSSSIFWYYRTVDLLRRVAMPLETPKDIVPVDYVAEALAFLLFKPQLAYGRYHISAGEGASVTWGEMAEAFARWSNGVPGGPYQVVDFATILEERSRLRELLGPGNEARLLRALEMLWRFSASGAQVFDNRRLLDEGLAPPPRFTSYLQRCATMPPGRSVYQQLDDDG
jgi:nucleoside-diphosphate-sugar epimerase